MARLGIDTAAHDTRRLLNYGEVSIAHGLDETAAAAAEAVDLIVARYLGNADAASTDPTLWEDSDGPTDQHQPPEQDPSGDL